MDMQSAQSRLPRLAASVVAMAGLVALTGCIADGPGGSPLGVAFAGTDDTSDGSGKDSGTTGSIEVSTKDVHDSDLRIAKREAAEAAERGTISGSAAIDKMIARHAKENGIPPALAFAVVRVESRYNPRARGRGVYGLSQIKPATARSLGFSGPASGLLDAETNLTYGMRYLKGAWEQGGHDVCRTAMKYQGGHRATRMTRAARSYCSKLKAQMALLDFKRSALGKAVPATMKTADKTVAEMGGKRVEAVAFAPDQSKVKDRSAPVSAVPATIRMTVGHATDERATKRGGRVWIASEDEANLAARLDENDATESVPVPDLRPSQD
ncbi:lytic transglycosylase domain-containing protein [Jiella sp. MQZ9-1]|uniref:Lytic transglycosylase domain-containing protein n=1 Tax=Jiella flava TaxID=2816857 RepID=A0A939JVR1_9HYPH|nr:lytic transglycosylase domain-containing protein [Jiella flava]MBO0662734.1 lytic transglycosylase domain-containing protein [Jiella flava]MCD2471156.1 lytic transglycosylase domain-containing protein [Jiella flava]